MEAWQRLVQPLNCGNYPSEEEGYDRYTHNALVKFALAWEQTSVADLSDRTRIDLKGHAEDGGNLPGEAEGYRFTETFLAAMPDALERAREEIATHGRALCPVLDVIADDSFQNLVQRQEGRSGLYQSHALLAQKLLAFNGCLDGAPDGLAGPQSIAAWNRATGGTGPRAGGHPTPGDVVMLSRGAAAGLACAPVAGQVETDSADALMVGACKRDQDMGVQTARLARLVRKAMAGPGFEAVGPALQRTQGLCDDFDWQYRLPAVVGVLARDLITPAADAAGVEAQVAGLVDLLYQNGVEDWRRELIGIGGDMLRALEPGADASLPLALQALVFDGDPSENESSLVARFHTVMLGLETVTAFPEIVDPNRELYADFGMKQAAYAQDEVRSVFYTRLMETGEGLDDWLAHVEGPFAETPWYDGEGDGPRPTLAPAVRLSLWRMQDGFQMAQVVAKYPEAARHAVETLDGASLYVFATLMLEGQTGQPKTDALIGQAAALLEAAVEKGFAGAALRLAQMHEQGYGLPLDMARAVALYETAAEAGIGQAMLALAQHYEDGTAVPRDWARAERLYGRALEGGDALTAATVAQIRNRRLRGLPFFIEGPGAGLLDGLYARMQEMREEEPYYVAMVGERIGLDYLAPADGGQSDLAEAARWLRLVAVDPGDLSPDSRVKLARLLAQVPELADPAAPDEIARLLDGTLEGAYRARPEAAALEPLVRDACAPETESYLSCIEFLRRASVGGVAPGLIAPAFGWLTAYADAERDELDRVGRLARINDDFRLPRQPLALIAAMDVLAFYGAYDAALERIMPVGAVSGNETWFWSGRLGTARNDAFRRMTARHVAGRSPREWDAFVRLLDALAARGDSAARGFAEIARTPPGALRNDLAAIPIEEARERFAIMEPLGATSRAVGFAARRLAPLEAAAGDVARAAELELVALGTDLARARVTEITDGPLPAQMTRICAYSHSSERLFGFGAPDLALSLARRAVNALNGVRRDLAGMPEDLQLCFRDTVADHYRWLADLYISRDRPAEADEVLNQLKAFETFRFAQRDPDYEGEGLSPVLEPVGEAEIVQALEEVKPTVTEQSLRRRVLLLKKKSGALDEPETAELETLNAALGVAAEARQALVAALTDKAREMGKFDAAQALSQGKSIKRYLKAGGGRRAAAIQYLVLDNRIGAVLTTPVSQQAFSWDTIGDEPLTPELLKSLVTDFRTVLRSPARDPRPLARRLHDLLLPEALRRELAAGEIDTLVLSLDGQLRYIPFGALYDGQDWLIARYRLVNATETAIGLDGEAITRISAFGTTHAVSGFSALPGVEREIAALVRAPGARQGLLEGTALLDDAFTRDAMAGALIFGDGFEPALGIVHIASHFKLAASEPESFLLMGDGGKLSVTDLREGFGIDLDFSEVGLLTLSACETGFGGAIADGSELESFASVAQQEGAQAVLATLWPVEDTSIAALMEEVYARHIRDGTPLDVALAETQRGFLGNRPAPEGLTLRDGKALKASAAPADFPGYSHPFYWAPVVLLQGAS